MNKTSEELWAELEIPPFLVRRNPTMINHVLLKNEGGNVPMSFLKRALEPNPEGIGLAIAGDGKLHIEAFPVTSKSAEQLHEILNSSFKDNFVMVQFTKTDTSKRKGIPNFGPFSAYEKGNFKLALAGCGLLPAWDNKDENRTGLNSLTKELITPLVTGLANGLPTEGLVNNPALRGLLESQVNQHGCFVCMDNDGYYVFVQGKDLKHRDYSWGWSSRDLGTFDEEMKKNPKVEEKPEARPPTVKVERGDDKQVPMELDIPVRRKLNRVTPKPGAPVTKAYNTERTNPQIAPQMKEAVSNIHELPNADLIPDNEVEKVQDMSLKHTGGGGTTIPSMSTVKKLIENTPDFQAQTGVDHTETLFYDDEALKKMQTSTPLAFFELFLSYRRDLLLRLQADFGSQHIPASATAAGKKVA